MIPVLFLCVADGVAESGMDIFYSHVTFFVDDMLHFLLQIDEQILFGYFRVT